MVPLQKDPVFSRVFYSRDQKFIYVYNKWQVRCALIGWQISDHIKSEEDKTFVYFHDSTSISGDRRKSAMPVMEIESNNAMDTQERPRRLRMETQRIFHGGNPNQKCLELEGVVKVLSQYADYEGGINCSICGKFTD